MSRKNYFFILLVIYSILSLLVFCPAFGFDNQDEDINLYIQSFEKAYFYFKNEGIFFLRDSRTAFKGAIWMLSSFSKNPLVLINDEEANLRMVKDYIKKLLTENPKQTGEILKLSIRGLFSLTDKYGDFIDAETFQAMMHDRIGNYEGDGAGIVFQDNKALILYVFSDTPAQKAGIKAGDEIIKINGMSFSDLKDANDLDERMRRVEDNFKPNEPPIYLYEIKRSDKVLRFQTTIIKIEKEKIVFYCQEGDIGIIEIKDFGYGCGTQFLGALNNLTACGIKGLIINLRDNPGGSVDEASIILKLLTDKGLKIELANGREEVWESYKVKRHNFNGPVVVLVNFWTASSAEIVAFCLQEDGVTVVGEKTYGKNYAQTFKILPTGDYIRLSVCWIKGLSGNSWPGGVLPDIKAPSIRLEPSIGKAKEIVREKMKEKEDRTSDGYILYEALLDMHSCFVKKCLLDSNKLIKARELNLF